MQQLHHHEKKSTKFEGCMIEYFESIGCISLLTEMSHKRNIAYIKGCLQCFDYSINPIIKTGDFRVNNNFYQFLIVRNGYTTNRYPTRFYKYLCVIKESLTDP